MHNDVAGAVTSVVVVVLLPVLLALAALLVPGPGGNPLASTGGLLRQATGVLVAGLRRVALEWLVWLATCLLFALAHALGSGGTFQLVTTFLLGSACFLARRVTGSLIGAIVVHAVYDAFLGYRTQTDGVPFLVSAAATLLLLVAAVAGLVVALRRPAR